MTAKILVTYASRTGSTEGVAQFIGSTLGEKGAAVDVHPVQAVYDLSGYQSVIFGSAVQGSQLLPEAMHFLRSYQNSLASKPFAAYLVCMTLAMPGGEKYREHVAGFMQPVRDLIKPVSEGLFAGTLNISKIPSASDRFKFRMSVLFGVWKEGDHRDWKAIQTWVDRTYPLLGVDS